MVSSDESRAGHSEPRADAIGSLGAPTIVDGKWQVFLRVAESGSLSKAGAVLDMPQSMVSRNISQLEQQCGERLFHRTGRGVVLTEFGTQLLPRVARLVTDANVLADDIRSSRGQPMGEVVVGLLPSVTPRLAGTLFAVARERYPGVRLHLAEAASAQLEEHLRDGRLDLAMVLREDKASITDEHVLARLSLHLVGKRGDPVVRDESISLASLARLPLVVPGRPHILRARLDRLISERKLDLHVAVEVDSVRLQHEVVAAGGGYAIATAIPGSFDDRLSSSRIVQPALERFMVLAETPRRPNTKATRAIRRLIIELAATLLEH